MDGVPIWCRCCKPANGAKIVGGSIVRCRSKVGFGVVLTHSAGYWQPITTNMLDNESENKPNEAIVLPIPNSSILSVQSVLGEFLG